MPTENDQFKAKGGLVIGSGEALPAELEGGKLKTSQIPSTVETSGRNPVNVKNSLYGALGNNSHADAPGIQAAFEAAQEIGSQISTVDGTTSLPIKQTVYIPDGTYLIGKSLEIPQGVQLLLAPSAIIKASAEMESMLVSGNSELLQDAIIDGGIWECNNLAQHGLSIPYFAHLELPLVRVYNAASHSIILGSPESTNPSYEAIVKKLRIWRNKNGSVPTSSYGLWLRSTDNQVQQGIVVGASTSFRVDGGNSMLNLCHGWGYSGHTPVTVFDDNAVGTTWTKCYADTPSLTGWTLRQSGSRLSDCTAYKGTAGIDNEGVAVKIEGEEPAASIFGLRIAGSSSEHRWAKDIEGSTKAVSIIGKQCANVVSEITANQIVAVPNRVGLVLRRASSGSGAAMQVISSSEVKDLEITNTGGGLDLAVSGSGLAVKEGSNAKQGTATLTAGKVIVSNTSVTANSRIFLTAQKLGTVSVPSGYGIGTVSAGVSFEIIASVVTDTSIIAYEIFEPG